MKKFILIFFALAVFTPISIRAQSVAANKAWPSFWKQFTSAVNARNKSVIKQLMVPEKEFSDGGGGGSRDQWLRNADKDKLWPEMQKSVARGSKPYNSGEKRPWRVTTDNGLLFVFESARWRFYGVMGD